MKRVLPFLISLCLTSAVVAQSPLVKNYHDYKSLTQTLFQIAGQNPDVVQVRSLGTTAGGRDIWLATLGAKPADDKPAIAIVGGVEAENVAGGELCLRFIEHAAQAWNTSDSVKTVLQNTTFYVLPRVNPDASEQLWSQPAFDRRLNANPIDLDVDGAVNEDDFDDLNGDGLITQMRVLDPAGTWVVDADEPRLLREADPSRNEKGMYRLLPEGRDNDGDGLWDEDPPGGVDFNQNFSFNYKPFVPGAGPFAMSEREACLVADFLFAQQNIAAVFSFSENENLLSPWQVAKKDDIKPHKPITAILPDDAKYFTAVSEQFKKLINPAEPPEPARGNGAFAEWVYYHYGRWSFAAPAWLPPLVKSNADSSQKDKKEKKQDVLLNERRLLRWADGHQQKVFMDWQAIDHPDFPGTKVEIGGFLPGAKNPPADSLAALSAKFDAFFFQLAGGLPKLEVFPKIEALGNNIYRVTAVIKNNGLLPTAGEMGAKSKWVRKVKAELLLAKNQRLVSGNRFYLVDNITGGGASEHSWLVMGERGAQVKLVVGCPNVGVVEKSLVLGE